MTSKSETSHRVERTSVVMRGDPRNIYYMLLEMYGEAQSDAGRAAILFSMAELLLQQKEVGDVSRNKYSTDIKAMRESEPVAITDGEYYHIFTDADNYWTVRIEDFGQAMREVRESIAYKNVCRLWEIIAIVAKEINVQNEVFQLNLDDTGGGLNIATQ